MVRTSFVADFVCLMSAPGGWVSTRYLKENGKRNTWGLGTWPFVAKHSC